MSTADHNAARPKRPPLRIAQVVSLEIDVPPKHQNGLEFVVSWLTEGLVRRGHQVTLFGTENSVTSATLVSTQPERLKYDDPKKNWTQPIRSMVNTLAAAMRADEFDVIHCHVRTIVFLAPFINTPAIQTLHHPANNDMWLPWFDDPGMRERLAPIAKAHNAIHYAAVSQKQKELFQAHGGDYFFKHVDVIHNGIPTHLFPPSYDAGDYLLYLGYITPFKGAHLAIEIAKQANKKLIIAGNYFGQEEYFKTQIEPHLTDTITYVGPVEFEQKVELYRHAQALLVPLQWDEPFGLTLVEAMACGTPVIAFDRGAAKEIVRDGVTGYICQSTDEAVATVSKINQIDRQACRQHTEHYFDVERMLDAYEDLYYSIHKKDTVQ